MELRQLRAVLAVAEHRHFGRAAAALGLTQPALSQAVKGLERDLGVPLLDRGPRHVTVTAAGEEFLSEARRAVSVLDTAGARARRAGRGEIGGLAVGMVGSALPPPIPRLLRAYRERYPDVAVSFTELTTGDQAEHLRAGTLDVGFLRPPLPAPAGDEIELVTVAREPLVVVLPRDHRLSSRHRVPLRALAGEPFVRTPRHRGPGLHDTISARCRDAGFEPRVAQEAVRMETVVALVGAGFGVSIVPGSVATPGHDDVVVAPLTPAGAPVELALARRRHDDTPPVAAFVALARDLAQAPAYTPR